MSRNCRPLLAALVLGPVLALAASGCAKNTHAQVSGHAVEDGKAYRDTGEAVQILMECDSPSVSISATVQPDGTFKFYGPEGKGLPEGKYKVGVESNTERAPPGVKKRIRDLSAEKSPMEIDLVGGEIVNLTIDLTKYKVSR